MKTKLMSEWKMMKIADVAISISTGGTPRRDKKEYWENGSINWLKISDMKSMYISKTEEKITKLGLENSSAKLFSKDTLVYSIFATLGAIGILDVESASNQAIVGIVPKKEIISTKYLYYCLQAEKNKIVAKKSHATQDNLNLHILRNHEIPVPPIHVQREIVSILEKAEKAKELRKESDELTKDLMKAVFLDMFGDPVKNNKKWKTKKLEEIASISRGKFTPRPRNDPKYFGGIHPFIQTGDISNSNHRLYNYKQTLNELGIKISKKFKKDTVVIAIVGATIGETAILKIDTYATDSVIGIIPDLKYLNPEYLEMVLRFWKPIFKIQAPEVARPNINNETLKPIEIPLPSIELQNQFTSSVKKIEQIMKFQKQSKEQIYNLSDNMIQKSFKGELT